jgi:MFS family permease
LLGCYPLALLVAIPFSAWISDRFGPIRALKIGTLGLFLTQLLYAAANCREVLYTARCLQGVSGGLAETAGLALLAMTFPAGKRGQALGTVMGIMSIGTLLGPPVGGYLFTWVGPRYPFVFLAGWTFLLAAGLFCTRQRGPRPEALRHPEPLAGWRDYFSTIVVVMLGAASLTALEPTLPLHLEERFGADASDCGLIFGLAALTFCLCSPLAGWVAERWGGRQVMIGGLIASMVVLPLVSLPRSWVVEAGVLIAFGVSLAFLLSPALPEIAAVCDKQKDPAFGTAYASFNMAYGFGMVVGPIASGFLKRTIGFGPALLTFSFVSLLVLSLLVLGGRVARTSQTLPG